MLGSINLGVDTALQHENWHSKSRFSTNKNLDTRETPVIAQEKQNYVSALGW